jgi:hypothetical protein
MDSRVWPAVLVQTYGRGLSFQVWIRENSSAAVLCVKSKLLDTASNKCSDSISASSSASSHGTRPNLAVVGLGQAAITLATHQPDVGADRGTAEPGPITDLDGLTHVRSTPRFRAGSPAGRRDRPNTARPSRR